MRKRLTSIFRPRLSEERGIALILTLAIIALVTLVLIAFVTSMRVENTASKSFNDLIKTREIALGAVDQAVATIRQATPQRTDNGAGVFSTYVTYPGIIWDNNNGVVSPAYLYSAPLSTDTTNLNAGFWITGQNPPNPPGEFTIEADSQIKVGWLYVAQDPSLAPGPANPIIGRYAYWVDDEASKINLNTAGVPTTPTPPDYGTSVSNDVDLSVLVPGLNTPANITAIQNKQLSPGFTTIEEVKLGDLTPTAPGTADSDFNTNRFYLTTYSNDANYPLYQDDQDAFDRQRLLLPALNIRDVNGTGGGGTNNAYTYLKDPALGNMYSLTGPGATFDVKYPVVGTANGLQQIIANIVAYQHDPQFDPVGYPLDGGGTPPVFLGLAKTPYINEVLVAYVFAGTTPNITVTRTVSVELYYMYDGTYTPAAGEAITVSGLPGGLPGMPGFIAAPVVIPVSGTFASGGYVKFTEPPELPVPIATAVTLPATLVQISYNRPYSGVVLPPRLDYSQMTLPLVTLDLATAVWHGSQAADPCVNDSDALPGRWEPYANPFPGTMGSRNVWQNSNPFTGGAGPAAYPFGADMTKAVIRTNAMQSVGELGYIHRPEPFKHLTLQPGGGGALGQIPDWAMLDLFTVLTPPTAGRININSFINPGPFPNPNVRRLVPLNALLNSASGMFSPTTVGQLAQQIYDDTTRSVGIDTYGMRNGPDGIFDSIGEICEAPGVADNATKSEADREATVRRIANLITVRSNTFTIWVLAQTIKQPPTNPNLGTYNPAVDLITGEVKVQAVVERYENPPSSAPKFRTRYFRYLYN